MVKKKIGVETISVFPQEKFWGPEKKLFGWNKCFGSNEAYIDLTATLSLIEVWHWRPMSCFRHYPSISTSADTESSLISNVKYFQAELFWL